MTYRNHRDYPRNLSKEYELLRSWLAGETGLESLREWLHNIYTD